MQRSDVEEEAISNTTKEEKLSTKSTTTLLLGMFLAGAILLAIVLPLAWKSGSDDDSGDGLAAAAKEEPPTTPAPSIRGGTTVPTSAPTAYFYETDFMAIQTLMQDFADQDFYMLNVIQYRDQAVYKDGRETDLTGVEANDLYLAYVLGTALPSIGAQVVFSTHVQSDFGNKTRWMSVGIVHYPNATAFRAMTQDATFQEMLAHKEAGVYDTIILACERQEDSRIQSLGLPEDVPWPPNATNLPVAMVNVVEYSDFAHYEEGDVDADNSLTGREAFAKYTDVAGPIVMANGVRPIGYFHVKAILAGQGKWDEIRINLFPSEENFYYNINDPVRKSVTHHRHAGVEDSTHGFKTSPIQVNQLVDWWDDLNPL